jgi:PAS domain S-box-containing protein
MEWLSDNIQAGLNTACRFVLLCFLSLHVTNIFGAIQLSSEEQAWIEEHPVVNVGADENWPPFDFIGSNNQHQGIASDYIQELEKITGLKFNVRGDVWKNVLDDIKSGKLDILACAVNTPERQAYLRFTAPYISIDTVIVVRKEQPNYESLGDLSGKRVALPKGTYINELLETQYPEISLDFVKSNQEAIQAVSIGKADAYVGNLAVVSYFIEKDLLTNLKIVARIPAEKNHLSIAISKDKPLLHSILSKGLASISNEKKREIGRKWINIGANIPEPKRLELSITEQEWINAHPIITVGVDGQWPPIDYINEDGNHSGITADYLKIISERLGIQLKIETGPTFKQMLTKLQQGELKLGASIVQTFERSQNLHFTQAFFTVHKVIITRKDSPNLKSASDLDSMSIVAEDGFSTIGELKKLYPGIVIRTVDSTLDALEAVSWGQADAYVGNRSVAQWLIQENELANLKFSGDPRLNPAHQRFAIHKDPEWQPLVGLIDKAMESISSEEHRQIQQRWLSTPNEKNIIKKIKLTLEEHEWLDQHPEIRLGVDPSWPPIEFLSEDGRYQGIASEYVAYISEQLGISMQPTPNLSWEEVIQKTKQGQIDVLPAVARSDEREKYLNFTKTYISFPFVVFLRNDHPFITSVDEISGQRVAVEKSYITEEYLRRDYPKLNLLLVNNTREGLEAVSLGNADAYIGNLATGSHIIERYGLNNLKVGSPTPYQFDLSLAVRKDWPELIPILEMALKEIPQEKHAEIRQKWFAVSYEKGIDYSLLWKVILIASILFMLGMIWFRHICRQKEALRLIEERFNLAIDASAEGIWDWHVDTGIVDYSDNYLTMLGYSAEDFPEKKQIWQALMHPADREQTFRKMKQQLVRPEITSFENEFRMRHKDGSYRYMHSISSVIDRNEKGRPIRIVGSQRDVTDKKEAEERLAIFHRFAETSNQGFAIATMDSKIMYSNQRLVDFVGEIEQEDMFGNSLFDYFSPDMQDFIRNGVMPAFIADSEWTGELKITSSRGHITPVLTSLILIRDKWGTPHHYGSIITDISDQKRFEAELTQAKDEANRANRFKSDFLANMSHEIRTPMNSIVGMSHLAQQTKLTSKQKNYLDTIQSSSQTLIAIINDILDFSKIEADKLNIEIIDFKLDEVLNNIGDMFRFKAEEKNIELLFNINQSVPDNLVGDPLRLEQVLINLTSNAFKFTEHGGIIISVTKVTSNNNRVVLKFSVKDTGIGLKPEQIENLFNPFFQADSSTTRQYGGTGLGLAICKRLVDMMDGEISVDSSYNEGSTFYFSADFGLQQESDKSERLPDTNLRGLNVLVIDDNKMAQEILSSMLSSFTFIVTAVSNAQRALEMLETSDQHFDLVILDWKMPGIDGIETARLIRQSQQLDYQPVIVMITAHEMDSIVNECRSLNIREFIRKPTSPSTLFDTIIRAIKQSPVNADKIQIKSTANTEKQLTGEILLVEDNIINQQVAQELLELFGLSVTVVDNGKQAIQKAQIKSYDLVFMDIQMPDLDGFETTRKIRQIPEFRAVPIIAMTAHAMAGDREKSLAAGMDDHITKPIDPDVLQQILRAWLNNNNMIKKTTINHDEIELQNHPGILDITLGLKHVIGNRKLLKKLLVEFHLDHENDVELLKQALDSGEIDKAEMLLHTLKGISANIGAHKLFDKVSILENKLHQNINSNDKDFAQFQDAFSEIMAILKTL